MEYNELYFKAKSNAKARTVWLILIAIMTLSYGSETSQGLHSAKYYTTFLLMAWVPFFIGILVLKINGKASSVYKEIVAVGYGLYLRHPYHGFRDRFRLYPASDKYADSF